MSRKQMIVTVQGKNHEWSFVCALDEKHLAEWRADGLEIYVLEYSYPEWVGDLGLAKAWCFLEDILRLRNPFM